MAETLYLFYHQGGVEAEDGLVFPGDAKRLATGLWLCRCEASRSRLYHRLKAQLPDDTGLLVAPLVDERDDWPKFKAMDAGALAWLRGK